jgi:hypothetical protein
LPTKTNTRGADVAQHGAAAEEAKSKTLDEAIVSEWNETQAGQVIRHCLSSPGRINNCVSQLLRLAGDARARLALIGRLPVPRFCAPTTPKFFSQKKSLAAGWGANQGTKDLPLPIKHLLPSLHHLLPLHILHGTFYYITSHTFGSLRSTLFPPNHLSGSHSVGICQHGKHRQKDTSSPVAPTPRRLLWEHTALRVVNTLNGLSAGVKHRLAAWAPWAYQRINFASGLT